MLYTKVHLQILDSTLADDWQARHVFEDLLKLVDYKTGVVDMTAASIARRLNVPLDVINYGLDKLSQPDPYSRSQAEEGRRIVLLDSHRNWGWRIVNYLEYIKLRDMDDKREADRERQRRHRGQKTPVTPSHDESHPVTPVTLGHTESQKVAYIDVDVDVDVKEVSDAKASSPRRDADGDVSAEEHIYAAYPRREGHRAAIKAIHNAEARLRKGEGSLTSMETREALKYLYRRAQAYARSPAGQRADKTLIPHPATWFNQSRYLDDEAMWQSAGDNPATNRKSSLEGMTFANEVTQ